MIKAAFTMLASALLSVAALQAASSETATSDWMRERQRAFEYWRYQHRSVEAQISRAASRTQYLVRHAPHALGAIDQPTTVWRTQRRILEVWDAPEAPQMVVIPAGEYTMGSPESDAWSAPNERPQHRVRIGYPLAISKFEITRAEFAQFVAETNYNAVDWCWDYDGDAGGGNMKQVPGLNWRDPGFPQTPDDPVVCVNVADAIAYTEWLSRKTGHAYRLLSESEWEYAARASSSGVWPAGAPVTHDQANFGTTPTDPSNQCCRPWAEGRDQWARGTAPVGSFAPNAFGLYDMTGNVWERLADCYAPDYADAPTDGSPRITSDCSEHVLRGSGWLYGPRRLRPGQRGKNDTSFRVVGDGFRVAREL